MHSFFVPSLAVQVYAFIGRTNEVWIDVPTGAQTYYGQCNQICGVNHAYMPIEVKALPAAEYQEWLKSAREEFAMSTPVPAVTPEAGRKPRSSWLRPTRYVSAEETIMSAHAHADHGAPTSFAPLALLTNHKDIGTMYIVFAILAAFIGGGLSVYMRMELMEPGVQYMEDGHVWNVFTTAHGLIMVFSWSCRD